MNSSRLVSLSLWAGTAARLRVQWAGLGDVGVPAGSHLMMVCMPRTCGELSRTLSVRGSGWYWCAEASAALEHSHVQGAGVWLGLQLGTAVVRCQECRVGHTGRGSRGDRCGDRTHSAHQP